MALTWNGVERQLLHILQANGVPYAPNGSDLQDCSLFSAKSAEMA
jgi:hypothetical protein